MSNDWNLSSNGWVQNNPLGSDAEQFLRGIADWAIYIRKDARFHCFKHFSESGQSEYDFLEQYCPYCLGTGFKTTATIVPSTVNLKQAQVSSRQTDERTAAGDVQYFETSINFPRSVLPQLEDIIIYCQWNVPLQQVPGIPRGIPLRPASIYIIKSINYYVEAELGWVTCGVENFDYKIAWVKSLLPYFNNLPVLPQENWPQNSYW